MMINKNLLCLLPIAAAIFGPLVSAWEQPKEYRVSPWGVPDSLSEGYPRLDGAKPGDIVSFHWTETAYSSSSDYNVYLYPTESCADEDGKEWIGSTSGASYEIKEWDQGKTLHFACDTDDYCERGMSIVINVSAGSIPAPTPKPTEWVPPTKPPTNYPTEWPTDAKTLAPTRYPTKYPTAAPTYADTPPPTASPTEEATDLATEDFNGNDLVAAAPKEIDIDNWVIPGDTQPFPPIEANVGDTIKWTINPGHDVWYHPSLTCDRTASVFVGDATEGGSYTFQPEDGSIEGKQHLFACQVGSHCDLGMQLLVTVFAQPQEQPALEEEPEEEVPPAAANNVELEWVIPADTQPFAPLDMNVGDSITFSMGPGHNVFIHPSGSCDQTDRLFVGDETVTYTFKPEDGSTDGKLMFFACDVGSHCDLGMQIAVNVFSQPQEQPALEEEPEEEEVPPAAANNVELEWLIPADTQPFAPLDMNVGDSITFSMGPGHNVFIHPSGSCDQTDRVFVGDETVTYTFKPEDGSPDGNLMFFACDVGSHCDLGMQIAVNVFSQGSASSSITTPPTTPSVGEADRVAGREIFIDWQIPEGNESFDPIEVVVGDTIIFSWEGANQNVFLHPSLTCDETFSIFVGLTTPTAYTFEPSDGSPDGKEHLFVSDVGENCELGMQLLVRVFSASDVTSDVTDSDVANPSSSNNPASSGSIATVVTLVAAFTATATFLLM